MPGGSLTAALVAMACSTVALFAAPLSPADEVKLWQYRNLGKAFYENPTTQKDAVDEFKLALAMDPNSVRDRVNYGLALLRNGQMDLGIAELEKVQKQDPKLPYTWFNLGIAYKKQSEFDRAAAQFEQMIKLVPDEPVAHYQLGTLLKIKGDMPAAIHQFEIARDLNPRLAAPHFQLFGLYRQTSRPKDAAEELRIFEQLKKEQEGAAVPEDMEWCDYAEIYDPHNVPPSAPLSTPAFKDERIAEGFTGGTPGVTALVLEPGQRPSLIAWSAAKTALFRDGKTAVAESGLEALRDVVFVAVGDFDNDGLPDLCVVTTKGAELYRNVNGKFQKQTDLASGSFRQALWLDYDHDYDDDLLLVGDDQRLLRNNGPAGFSDETKRFPFVAAHATGIRHFEIDPDKPGFHVLISYQDHAPVLYSDRLGGVYVAQPQPAMPGAPSPDEQADLTKADFAGNGRLDHARIAGGALYIERNVTPNYGNWIEVSLLGIKNPKISLNARVEVKAGTFYDSRRYLGVPLVYRVGDRTKVDTVRITWPNGMMQNETNQPVNKIDDIKEAPRLSGSCPMIFTWNGEQFDFITDVLGVAPLGASSGDGQYFPVDHDEWVSIPGDKLKVRDGGYDVRMTEELHEVSYIDQIKLVALDHPAGEGIVTNEKFKSPPYPEFRLFGVDRKVFPLSAHDSEGNDVRDALLTEDHIYPDRFRRDMAGVAELHHLDLDFGKAAASNHAVLVLEGWVDWADGSTFLAASQAHRDLIFPYLQVKDAAGNWKTVVEDMGMPSGKPKPMAVDLAGKFLSSSREIRIVTNLCVYWDQIYLVENDAPPQARMTTMPIATADVHFRGFSRPTIDSERLQPERFDYQTVNFVSNWNPTPGNYTRYGPVETLLAAPDDRMVIMGSGDEIRMRFSAAALPALPAGWKRDFLLLVDGWAKDADANTAFSQSVLPLPFHGMSSYPYPAGEQYPRDQAHADYIHDYLTRPALRLIRPLSKGD
jgi:tetratricopeptide (TPR) repeat protein